MKIYSNFDELYADLRNKLPRIEHPVVDRKEEKEIEISDSMTKAELLAVAEENGVAVSKKATKAEIIEAIKGEK